MINQQISNLGTTPEVLVDQMRLSLNEIIAKTYHLNGNKKVTAIQDQMKDLYNKLNIAKLTYDRNILSITGLQGVGKTKIARDLFGLDASILPSDGGRGEALPILFTEQAGLESIAFYVRRAVVTENNMYELKDEKIALEQFNAIASNPYENDLWLEILLPQRHFHTDISLALLPGFEKDKTERSQKYLELFLTLSTSLLLVFNHKVLARENQQILIDRVAADFKDSAPIFALSFAEELNVEEKAGLEKDLCEKFVIPKKESDRIVFTGTSDDLKDFPKDILHAIQKYALTNASGYKKQLRILGDLTEEITALSEVYTEELASMKIDFHMDKQLVNEHSENMELQEIHQAFQHFRKRSTRTIKNEISKTFSSHAEHCSNEIVEFLAKEKFSIFEKFKKSFSNSVKYKEKHAFEKRLKDTWNGETGTASERKLVRSLDSFVVTEVQALERARKIVKPVDQEAINPLLPLASTSEEATDYNDIIKVSLDNIDRYLNSPEGDLSIQLTKDDLKVLPIVAVSIAQELVAVNLKLEIEGFHAVDDELGNMNTLDEFEAEFKDVTLATSNVVKGSAIFFGLDAMDGTFNSFGALTSLLTSVGIKGSLATPIGLLLVGTLGGGLAVHKGAARLEKFKFERDNMAREIFKSVSEIQRSSMLATIEKVLDEMEDRLIEAHHRRRGTDRNFGLLDELDNRVLRLQHLCGDMKELMFRNEAYIN